MSDLRVVIRPARETDNSLIFDAWLDSFRGAHAAGPFPMHMYRAVYTQTIEELLARPNVRVLIACDENDDDQDVGFLIHELRQPPVVHYIYVKSPWRKKRVASMLMAAAQIPTGRLFVYTFKTALASRLVEHWTGGIWDPFCARFPART